MRKLRLSTISDLHGNLPAPDFFEEGDVLGICGDIVPLKYQSNITKSTRWFYNVFIPWTDTLPFDKVIVIFGNHDFFGESIDLEHISSDNNHKIVVLRDNKYEYKGFAFYGTSWCPDLDRWAFYGGHNKLKEEYAKIPNDTDVLLSHCPPKIGSVGVVLQSGYNWMRDFGCQELADAIHDKHIGWVFCGHVHSGNHYVTNENGTNIVNVSMLDEDYKKQYLPFSVEIEKNF